MKPYILILVIIFLTTSCSQDTDIFSVSREQSLTKKHPRDYQIDIYTSNKPDNLWEEHKTRSLGDDLLSTDQVITSCESVILPQFASSIWLGNVLNRKSVAECKYTPIIGPKKNITISLSLPNTTFSEINSPSLLTYSKYLQQQIKKATFSQIPESQFSINQFTYYDEIKTAIGNNTNINFLFGGSGKSSDQTNYHIHKMTGLYIKFWQTSFTATMDDPDIPYSTLQKEYEDSAVFINSITYGRLGIMAIETNEDFEVAKSLLQKSFHALMVGGRSSLTNQEQKFLEECDTRAYIQGGEGSSAAESLTGLEAFLKYVKNEKFSTKQPGVPIFCTFENVSDNSLSKIHFKFHIRREPIYVELIDSINTAVTGELHHLSLNFYKNLARFPELANPSIKFKIEMENTDGVTTSNPIIRTFQNLNSEKGIKLFSYLGSYNKVYRISKYTQISSKIYTTAKLCKSPYYNIIGNNPQKIYFNDKNEK